MRWVGPVGATAALLLCVPGPVVADPWTPVATREVEGARPDVQPRTIVWSTPAGTLNRRAIRPTGRLGSTQIISRGWTYLTPDPVGVSDQVVAAGVRSIPGSPAFWPGGAFSATGDDPLALGTTDFAYLSQGQDAIPVAGRTVYAYTDGGAGVTVLPQDGTAVSVSQGTAAYQPALAASGMSVRLAWYAQGRGIVVVPVTGLPSSPAIGQVVTAPGSTWRRPEQRVPLVVRGLRAWTAYPSGERAVRVWEVGSATWQDIAATSPVTAVDLAPAGRGRIWLAYATEDEVCVRRSDAFGGRFGDPTCKRVTASAVAVAGRSAADVVVTAVPRLLHARLLPALSVTGLRVAGTIRVVDAGMPVARARVDVGHRAVRTNRRGLAKVGPWAKRADVVVTARGYQSWRGRLG